MRNHVYAHPRRSDVLLLDVQANWLNDLGSRAVIPLVKADQVLRIVPQIHPTFQVNGEPYIMLTDQIMSVLVGELGPEVCSLGQHYADITAALDVLLSGV